MNMHVATEPFKQPVDIVKLKIPDYPLIVTNPMDLSTSKTKLTTGKYSEPSLMYWLMFDNAWLYNKEKSAVHDCCTEV